MSDDEEKEKEKHVEEEQAEKEKEEEENGDVTGDHREQLLVTCGRPPDRGLLPWT